jgi:predicted NUDIX family NTP pyrophosphohydrolase
MSYQEGMRKRSAGVILFRFNNAALEVLLVHPGGPYWANKDAGAWSIPKGEYSEGEDALAAAKREFAEETGVKIEGEFLPLGEVKQAGGKMVQVWALAGNLDPSLIRSKPFTLEWPPKSGLMREFPEVDSAGWFTIPVAKQKLLFGQREFLARLCDRLGV